jgi:hypothetical protein
MPNRSLLDIVREPHRVASHGQGAEVIHGPVPVPVRDLLHCDQRGEATRMNDLDQSISSLDIGLDVAASVRDPDAEYTPRLQDPIAFRRETKALPKREVLLKDALRNLRFDWKGAGEIEGDVYIPEEINIRPTRLSVESAPEGAAAGTKAQRSVSVLATEGDQSGSIGCSSARRQVEPACLASLAAGLMDELRSLCVPWRPPSGRR